jgi:hypothetical protein
MVETVGDGVGCGARLAAVWTMTGPALLGRGSWEPVAPVTFDRWYAMLGRGRIKAPGRSLGAKWHKPSLDSLLPGLWR